MKLNRTLYVVAAIATLSLSSQAFARGGGAGGSVIHGSAGGTHQTSSKMSLSSGSGMQHGNTTNQGPVGGVEAQNMSQGDAGNNSGHQLSQAHVKGTGMTAQQSPVTTAN